MELFDLLRPEAVRVMSKVSSKKRLIAAVGDLAQSALDLDAGDTVAALNQAKVADDFTFVSTAGGAFLEWMEGKPLPGVEALKHPT